MIELTVPPAQGGERVDRYVAGHLGASHHAARRLIEANRVRVNGRRTRKGVRLQAGDRVTIAGLPPDAGALRPLPQPELPLVVLHQDEELVAMAKPAGPPSHPLAPGELGTLANALVARFPECAAAGDDPREGGLLHRLDAGTSGVVVAARSPAAWRALREHFRGGQVVKVYLALVAQAPLTDHGTISAPLASRGRRSVVSPTGRAASTDWRVVERLQGGLTLLELTTRTGRMHQVRAHLAHAELPIVGDALYGGPPCPSLEGHFLHAARLELPGRPPLAAPLPPDRAHVLAGLRGGSAETSIGHKTSGGE
jgi:23S rRNA pseudouridine1911/1915/1917 synthase